MNFVPAQILWSCTEFILFTLRNLYGWVLRDSCNPSWVIGPGNGTLKSYGQNLLIVLQWYGHFIFSFPIRSNTLFHRWFSAIIEYHCDRQEQWCSGWGLALLHIAPLSIPAVRKYYLAFTQWLYLLHRQWKKRLWCLCHEIRI